MRERVFVAAMVCLLGMPQVTLGQDCTCQEEFADGFVAGFDAGLTPDSDTLSSFTSTPDAYREGYRRGFAAGFAKRPQAATLGFGGGSNGGSGGGSVLMGTGSASRAPSIVLQPPSRGSGVMVPQRELFEGMTPGGFGGGFPSVGEAMR